MDYRNIGLNQFLQPINAPISNTQQISSYEFDYTYGRGAVGNIQLLNSTINNAKIRNSFRAYNIVVSNTPNDGDTNDIQEAVDTLNKIGGGTILLATGTYVLSSDITLYSNITIEGADRSDTIIDCNNTAYGLRSIGSAGNELTDIHLKNFTIKNNQDTTQGALYFSYTDIWSITNISFENNVVAGAGQSKDIVFNNCEQFTIKDNSTFGADVFVSGSSSEYFFINENFIFNCINNGIEITSSGHFSIIDNEGRGMSGSFVHTSVNCFSYRVALNSCWEFGEYGVYVSACDEGLISNNILTTGGIDGVYVVSGNGNSVIGNMIRYNNGYGVRTGASANKTLIDSNNLNDNTGTYIDGGTATVIGSNIL